MLSGNDKPLSKPVMTKIYNAIWRHWATMGLTCFGCIVTPLSLTCWDQETQIHISEQSLYWFRQWLVAYSMLSHRLNQWLFIVNWTHSNKIYEIIINKHKFFFEKMDLKMPYPKCHFVSICKRNSNDLTSLKHEQRDSFIVILSHMILSILERGIESRRNVIQDIIAIGTLKQTCI